MERSVDAEDKPVDGFSAVPPGEAVELVCGAPLAGADGKPNVSDCVPCDFSDG